MGSIQLGIQHAVGGLASKPERDLLMQDFMTVETTNFPSEGSNHTPAHHFSEFKFKNYAPIAFRYFRDLFGIQPDDFLVNINWPTYICVIFFCYRKWVKKEYNRFQIPYVSARKRSSSYLFAN